MKEKIYRKEYYLHLWILNKKDKYMLKRLKLLQYATL